MKQKQAALLRDLGKLFSKYSARDWELVFRLLRAGTADLEQAASDKIRQRVPGKPDNKESPSKTARASKEPRSPNGLASTGTRKSGSSRLAAKQLTSKPAIKPDVRDPSFRLLNRMPTARLRMLYAMSFKAKHVPASRKELISKLNGHLQKFSAEKRAGILISFSRRAEDPAESYQRWTKIISRGPS